MIKKVIGIGNALTDIVINIPSDELLKRFLLPKGSMNLIDAEKQYKISQATAGLPKTLSLGGSAANTIRALAHLGTDVALIGKVGADNTGDFFIQALDNLCVKPMILRGEEHSGRCVSLVTPDGERTMATHLGAALEMNHGEVQADHITPYDCLYIEGYLVQDHDLIWNVAKMAKECGLKIAMDLASYNVVTENLDFLRKLVNEFVDIIFANEQEAEAFTAQSNPMEALEAISDVCELTVVKVGIKGAYIKRGDEFHHVGIMAAAKRVDTTGAGDFYAAGFLSGLTNGLTLEQCGTIGAITAGKVIEVVGTTLGEEAWNEIERLINRVKTERYLF